MYCIQLLMNMNTSETYYVYYSKLYDTAKFIEGLNNASLFNSIGDARDFYNNYKNQILSYIKQIDIDYSDIRISEVAKIVIPIESLKEE